MPLVAACEPLELTSPLADLADHTFPPDSCGAVIPNPPASGYALVDGEVTNGSPGAHDRYSVTLGAVSHGDLTADGHPEAAVILYCSPGNRPHPVGWVMTSQEGEATTLAAVPAAIPPLDAQHVHLAGVQIGDGRLWTEWYVTTADDGWCCPTGVVRQSFRWDGSRFVRTQPEPASENEA